MPTPALYLDPSVARVSEAIAGLLHHRPMVQLGGLPGGVRVVHSSELRQQAEEEFRRLDLQKNPWTPGEAIADGFDPGRIWYTVEQDGLLASVSTRAQPDKVGFDASKTWFHGTNASRNFRSFKAGDKGVDELGTGVYFTSDPDVAQAWAGRPGDGGRIIPVILRKGEVIDLSRPLDYLDLARRIKDRNPVTDDERLAAKIRSEKDIGSWSRDEQEIVNRTSVDLWRSWLHTTDEELAAHIREGRRHLGPRWTMWLDRAGYIGAVNPQSQIRGQIVVFDPRNIRTPWARFNPKKWDSPDLLHSVARPAGSTRSVEQDFVFHVTPASNVEAILLNGISTQIGARSAMFGESVPASFHFTSVEALTDGLMGWAGDAFASDEKLAVLAVRRDMALLLETPGAEFEAVSTRDISPGAISLITADLDSEIDLEGVVSRVLQQAVQDGQGFMHDRGASSPPVSDFKAWFGDSQVVDERGVPRVVYHGTSVWTRDDRQLGDIQHFDRMASVNIVRRKASIDTVGSWFSTNPGAGGAEMYSGTSGAIYPVYLSIRHPLVTTFDGMATKARELAGLKAGEFVDGVAVEAFRDWLQSEGYDGIRIVHDESRQAESTEFKGQDAWIALHSDQIRFALGVRITPSQQQLDEVMHPRVGDGILASLPAEGLHRMLREFRLAKARAIRSIGEVGDCAIVQNESADAWQMILRDASEPGKWRTQHFDARGFSGHMTFDTQAEAIEAAARAGFSIRDDDALDRIQNTPAFQRGIYAAELIQLVNCRVISFEEGSRRLALYDARATALASVGASAAQAYCIPATGTIVMVADRIAVGEEGAVFLHEIMHAHGRKTIGNAGWDRLVGGIRSWSQAASGSLERDIHDAAYRRASNGAWGRGPRVFEEELLAYGVEEAVLRGVRPSLEAREGSADAWLADVQATLQGVIFQFAQSIPQLSSQELVDLAYALAQLENPVHGPALRARLGAMDPAVAQRLAHLVSEVPLGHQAEFQQWTGGLPVIPLGEERVWASGEPLVAEVLHGTMSDFSQFDVSKGLVDGNLGAGIYASNDLTDVNTNYAGYGIDKTTRIETLKEVIEAELWDGGEDPLSPTALHEMAEKRSGIVNQGFVMPLYMRLSNPCVIGGHHETTFTCGLDKSGRMSGSLVDFLDALKVESQTQHLLRSGVLDAIAAELLDDARDDYGRISISAVMEALRWQIDAIDCESGAPSTGELMRSALEAVGFDGVIDTQVYSRFNKMPGTSPLTVHFVAFHPKQVASCLGSTWGRGDVGADILKSEFAEHMSSVESPRELLRA